MIASTDPVRGLMTKTFDHRLLPVTTAMAAAMLASGCSRAPDKAADDIRICQDYYGKRLYDRECTRQGGGSSGAAWHYLRRGQTVPQVGDYLRGGTRTPVPGVHYGRATSATVVRRGFGLSGFSGRS